MDAFVRDRDWSAALTEFKRYDDAFHDAGQLAASMAALKIEALCGQGMRSPAAHQRAAFVARWPTSPEIDAIDRACGAPAP
ncbi:MAG TPA: hypothetical protein VHE35_04260 [Kofleriaceae bacterium]|nr:hypothetical protein [Kofleriaceae bacterium]